MVANLGAHSLECGGIYRRIGFRGMYDYHLVSGEDNLGRDDRHTGNPILSYDIDNATHGMGTILCLS
jgi:hypothetical protein